MTKKMKLDYLVKEMRLEVLSGIDKLKVSTIKVYGVNRAGLELTGFFVPSDMPNSRRLVLLSYKENQYIHQFNAAKRRAKYQKLIDSGIPAIIVTPKFNDPVLLNLAKELDFPMFRTEAASTHNFVHDLLALMDDFFMIIEENHGTLVNIYGKGILLIGQSGIGKSEIALDLIKKNHLFVGDDRIIIHKKNNRLYGRADPILENLIEVRGIGIIDIALANGYEVILNESEINLVIELFSFLDAKEDSTDRLGTEYQKINYLGVFVPFLRIPVSPGKNIANIVETAVTQLKIKTQIETISPIELINQRLKDKQTPNKD